MPNVNIRQLRNTRKLKAWLRAGKTVELRERDKVIARIVPAAQQEAAGELPDFAARRENIFGNRVLSGADLVIETAGTLLTIYADTSFFVSPVKALYTCIYAAQLTCNHTASYTCVYSSEYTCND
jgi:antitoxin (DNA-binding transcriptional repressor) of toxin-antitoxin stability system